MKKAKRRAKTLKKNLLTSLGEERIKGNNILIGSWTNKEAKKLFANKNNYLWIKGLIEGDSEQKWVSIKHDLKARDLYAQALSPSDKRLKKDIEPLAHSLSQINKIKSYSFKWKDKSKGEALQRGIIAQELNETLPELVKKDKDGILSINYPQLVPIIISAFQEWQAELKKRLLSLTKKMNALGQQFAKLHASFTSRLAQLENKFMELKSEILDFGKKLVKLSREFSKFKEETDEQLKEMKLKLDEVSQFQMASQKKLDEANKEIKKLKQELKTNKKFEKVKAGKK